MQKAFISAVARAAWTFSPSFHATAVEDENGQPLVKKGPKVTAQPLAVR
jgi:hypothetical protein